MTFVLCTEEEDRKYANNILSDGSLKSTGRTRRLTTVRAEDCIAILSGQPESSNNVHRRSQSDTRRVHWSFETSVHLAPDYYVDDEDLAETHEDACAKSANDTPKSGCFPFEVQTPRAFSDFWSRQRITFRRQHYRRQQRTHSTKNGKYSKLVDKVTKDKSP